MQKFLFLLVVVLFARLLFFYTGDYTVPSREEPEEIQIFSQIRERISDNFYRVLPQDHAALLLGITLGVKAEFSKGYFQAIRNTGVLHVIAASGMNVSMLLSFLLSILVSVFDKKKALVIASICIIFYTGLASFQPSIVRASIMALFGIGALITGRQNTSLLALFFAAFVMILADPLIIGDIGFELSFAATLGLILFDPILKLVGGNILFEDLRTTLSAQVTTVPIFLFYFSTYSPVTVISNLLIFWTIPPLMILGAIGGILSITFPISSTPFLWISLPLLAYFKWSILFTNNFAVQIKTSTISPFIVVGYYLLVLSLVLWIYKRKNIKI